MKKKAIEKKFEVYSIFINQMDEMSLYMRNDSNIIYEISNDFVTKVITGNKELINNTLINMKWISLKK